MKKVTTVLALLLIASAGFSQNVGKMTYKDEGFTQKKFNHSEKKIYLQ